MMKANFHIHTTASDGLKTVNAVIEQMRINGINYIAKTDHDTLVGDELARLVCKKYNINYVSGVEVSSYASSEQLSGVGKACICHILGLGVDYEKMSSAIYKIECEKQDRIFALAKLLVEDGYKIDDGCLYNCVNGKDYKRVLAQELVRNGYATSVYNAFDSILNNGKYFELCRYPLISDVIKIIHGADGYAIWAHPYKILGDAHRALTEEEIEKCATQLKNDGLDGLEVYYLQFGEKQVEFLEGLADRLNLYKSIGTDYHAIDVMEEDLLKSEKLIEYTEKASKFIDILFSK